MSSYLKSPSIVLEAACGVDGRTLSPEELWLTPAREVYLDHDNKIFNIDGLICGCHYEPVVEVVYDVGDEVRT